MNDAPRNFLCDESDIRGVCSCLCYSCKVSCWIWIKDIDVWWLALVWIADKFCQWRNCWRVKKLVASDRWLSVCFIAESVGISAGSRHSILTEALLMKRCLHDGCHEFYPMFWGKSSGRISKSPPLVKRKSQQLFSWFINVDETWLHHFILKVECNVQPGNMSLFAPPRKCHIVTSAGKVVTTLFCDADGTVLTDHLGHGSTITGTYYADLIGIAWAALKEKRWGKLRLGMLFQQDNAPDCTSSQALTAISNAGFQQLLHLPYLGKNNSHWTIICLVNWKNFQNNANLLMTRK